MEKKERVLHFSISGEFITNFMRDLYMESGDLPGTIEKFITCISGLQEDTAKNIILGKKKFTGQDNDIILEDDNLRIIPHSKTIRQCSIDLVEAGWISPKGEVYGVMNYTCRDDHIELAQTIVNALDISCEENDPSYALECLGYIKFTPIWVLGGHTLNRVTDKQKEVLIDLVKNNPYLKVLEHIQLGYDPKNVFSYLEVQRMDEIMIAKHINCMWYKTGHVKKSF